MLRSSAQVQDDANTHQTTHPHQDHRHTVAEARGKDHDLGLMGVLVHLVGDAINNIGVIIAAAVIWKAKYEGRFYADPGVSMGIAIMILLSALPLGKVSLLMQCLRRAHNIVSSQKQWYDPARECAARR